MGNKRTIKRLFSDKEALFGKVNKIYQDSYSVAYEFDDFVIDIREINSSGNEAIIMFYRILDDIFANDKNTKGKLHSDLSVLTFGCPVRFSGCTVFSKEGADKIAYVASKLLNNYYFEHSGFCGYRYKYTSQVAQTEYNNLKFSGFDSISGLEIDFMVYYNYNLLKDDDCKEKHVHMDRLIYIKNKVTEFMKDLCEKYKNSKIYKFNVADDKSSVGESFFNYLYSYQLPSLNDKIITYRFSIIPRSIQEANKDETDRIIFPQNYCLARFFVIGFNLMKYIDHEVGKIVREAIDKYPLKNK